MDKFVENFLTFGARRPWIAAAIVLVASVIAAYGAIQIKIDTSYDRLISDTDPGWPDYQRTVREFGSDSTTIIFLRDSNLFTPEKLTLLDDLAVQLKSVPGIERVDSLFTALSIRDVEGQIEARPLMDIVPDTAEDAAKAREDALYSPLIRRNLVSPDGRTTAVTLTANRANKDPEFTRAQHAEIEKRLDAVRGKFERVFQIGPPRLNVEIERGMVKDIAILMPLSTALLIGTVLYFLRTWMASIVPLVTAGISILWTFGYMGWTGTPLTLLTALVPSLNIVIGSAEDTHMMAAYLRRVAEQKKPDRQEAIRYMAKHIGIAIFLTSSTTSIGFLTDALHDVPLVVDFGLTAAFALTANFFATTLLMPLMLLLIGPTSSKLPPMGEAPTGRIGTAVAWVESFGRRRQKEVLIGTGVIVAFFAFFALQIKVSNDPLSYFPDSSSLVQDAKALQKDLAGMQVFYVTLEADESEAFKDPKHLKTVEAVQQVMRRQELYDLSVSLADHVAMVNREMNGGKAEAFRVPDTRDLVEQYLLFFKRTDIERYVSPDYRRTNIVIRHSISDSSLFNERTRAFVAEAEKALTPGVRMRLSGENLMINRTAEGLITNQVDSLLWVIGTIFILMALLYQSITAGVISMIPNVIPTALCFGVMGLLGIPLNPGTVSVAAVALGIAIDDTIHFFSRYLDECKHEPDADKAVRNTMWSEAVPVVTTTIALSLGFGILMLSNFTIVVQYGFLAALTMVIALACDLFLTPVLVRNFRLVSIWDVAALKVRHDVLRNSPLFLDMKPAQIKKAMLLSSMTRYKAGEQIFSQGSRGDSLYVVLDGQIDVIRVEGGQARNLARLGPGEVFGEVGFVKSTERTASIRAISDVELLALNAETTRRALRLHPFIAAKLNLNISRILGSRLAATLAAR
ncbi:MAG: cyclic nucleotide-binding domain-containing protein [Alphaproteobacteria bacterium]|nr:cyclic nucleotide-binding domain-containing protein [Alphaproteobacteria bacterium]